MCIQLCNEYSPLNTIRFGSQFFDVRESDEGFIVLLSPAIIHELQAFVFQQFAKFCAE